MTWGLSLTERELSRMAYREALFTRRGIAPHRAGAMADECVLRDRQRLDMHFCVECSRMQRGNTCAAAARGFWPGVQRLDVTPDQFVRCPAFRWQTPS